MESKAEMCERRMRKHQEEAHYIPALSSTIPPTLHVDCGISQRPVCIVVILKIELVDKNEIQNRDVTTVEWLLPKSLYRSCAGRHFYGTENEIWAGFRPVGNTEKKLGGDHEQLLRVFLSCFQGQKKIKFFQNIVASALKCCIVRKPKKEEDINITHQS